METYRCTLFVFLIFLIGQRLQSQSLIVGIPSADIVHKGALELTHESQTNFWSYPTVDWNSFSFLTYGIGYNAEATISINNLASPASKNISLGLGVKKVWEIFPSITHEWELKGTYGQNVLFSLERQDVGGWAYGHLSFRIPKIKTRLTGGFSYGSNQLFGYRVQYNEFRQEISRTPLHPFAAIVGFEQPITKHFSVIADWYSGNHALAMLIPAVQMNIGHSVFILGYKIPNSSEFGGNAIVTEVMIHLGELD